MTSQEPTAKTVRIESQATPLGQFFSIERHPSRETAFAIRAKGLAPLVSRVYYEKDEQDLRLYFTLQRGLDLTIIVGDTGTSHNYEGVPRLESPLPAPTDRVDLLYARLSQTILRNTEKGVRRACIALEDFQATGATPKDLPRLIETLAQRNGDGFSTLALFETRGGVRAVLQSSSEISHALFSSISPAARKGGWSLSLARWNSLARAQEIFSLFL